MAIQKITSNVIADTAVTSAKLANNSVGIAQLNVSDGTNGQLLKTDGSGTLSFGDAPASGSRTRLSTTVVNSQVSSVEISLTGSYTAYELLFFGVHFGSNAFGGHYAKISAANQSGTYVDLKWLRNGYGGNTSAATNQFAVDGQSGASIQTGSGISSYEGNLTGEMQIFNVAGKPSCKGVISHWDDDTSLDIGLTNFMFGFSNPGSSDTMSKIRFEEGAGEVTFAGTWVLYGITTS